MPHSRCGMSAISTIRAYPAADTEQVLRGLCVIATRIANPPTPQRRDDCATPAIGPPQSPLECPTRSECRNLGVGPMLAASVAENPYWRAHD